MVAATTRIAYAQVDNFLSLLEEKYVEMVPRNIRYFFKQEKDINYNVPIVPDIPIKNQNLTTEALALIAYLNLNYWCKDEEEKEKLKDIYKKNDEEYNKELARQQHGGDELFNEEKNLNNFKTEYEEENVENDIITYKKDNIFRRILLKIKSKFLK